MPDDELIPLAVIFDDGEENHFSIGNDDYELARPHEKISDEEVLIVRFAWSGQTATLINPGGFTAADLARELNSWYETTRGCYPSSPEAGIEGDHVFVEAIRKSERPGIDLEIECGS